MSFNVPAPRDEVVASDVAPIAGYLNGASGATYEHTAARAGNSTTLYADTVIQRDPLNGLIARWGYGAAGSETYMLTVTKTGVSLTNPVFTGTLPNLLKGPIFFDVEAYASASDLAADSTFEWDTDASTAINAAIAAARTASVIYAASGTASGWANSVIVRFNSKVYRIDKPINATKLGGAHLIAPQRTNIYCGDAFSAATPTNGGTAPAATAAPMFDMTGSSSCYVYGITLAAQTQIAVNPAPTVQPGAGFLVASLETYNAGWAGGGADSNNNTFDTCSVIGWPKLAGWAFINTVIQHLVNCGGQIYDNTAATHALYIGQTTLNTSGVADSTGALDSAYYPTIGSPNTSDQRMCRTEVSAAGYTLDFCEFHDMCRYNLGGTGRDNTLSTIYLYKAAQVVEANGRHSSSGRAVIELVGDLRGFKSDGTEYYNDAINSTGSNPQYLLYNNNLGTSTPAQDVTFSDCILNMVCAVATIGGVTKPAFRRLRIEQCRVPTGGTLIDLATGCAWSAGDNVIIGGYIEADGTTINVGNGGNGNVSGGLMVVRPGGYTVSGDDDSAKFHSSGGIQSGRGGSSFWGDLSVRDTSTYALYADLANLRLAIGANTWSGSEKLRVVGAARVEGALVGTSTAVFTGAVSGSAGAFGTSPAAAGALRIPINDGLKFRNSSGNDANIVSSDGSNNVNLGQVGAGIGDVYIMTPGQMNFYGGGVVRFQANGTGVSFNGAGPVAAPSYTVTNPTTNRSLDVTGATLGQLAQVVGTMIRDLKSTTGGNGLFA